jgi:hypothetical protein
MYNICGLFMLSCRVAILDAQKKRCGLPFVGSFYTPLCKELFFFNLPNPSSRTMALGSTQPLREMSTKSLPEGGGEEAAGM